MTSSPNRTVAPPRGGDPPPAELRLSDGEIVWLRPVAEEISRRLRAEFPEEEEYGDAGFEWCVHDNQYLVRWATLPEPSFRSQLDWLARLLEARGYPLERLSRDLAIAADVVAERWGERAADVADRLRAGARSVTPRRP